MGRLFGTDGVRGLANVDLTAGMALGLAAAAATVLVDEGGPAHPRALVARDPRASGEFLSAAVVAGLAGSGVDVLDVGVVPTPALAHLVQTSGADFGVVLSASHNAMPDNGLKIFARGGTKLPDEVEDRIEAAFRSDDARRPTGSGVGRVHAGPDVEQDAQDTYVDHLLSTLPGGPGSLAGLHVVVDCANGAASAVSPRVLREAGARVTALHAAPDGLNINDGCGSTHLGPVSAAVLAHGADLGLAHDGDADRCLAVDAAGNTVDGDQIMAVLALALRDRGQLVEDTLVATVMSNLGLKLAMQREGVTVVETGVGDRYVLEALNAGGWSLGGEQSGHVVLPAHATTGDGVLTGLQLLARMAETGRSLADLAGVVDRLPQVLVNVRGVDKSRAGHDEDLLEAVADAERELGSTGRVLLRPSGTEPLVRVMVEAARTEHAQDVADRLAEVVRKRLAL
ncbi:phosphoglucosamine mutase [Kineococcus aurantiacus]|uniref:Phosphoglucosamine mutase n=1 Tax=Kineococcus aurantiacus TaxID=37633 RepID=A0A7Y9J016_9ACTN|nr:phosphoglucosamine mutase [Kineococcus aurantiacus]